MRISKEESELFRAMVEDVKPYQGVALSKHESVSEPIFLSDYYTEVFNPEDSLEYLAMDTGLSPKLLRLIRRGEYPIEGNIDLHGDTVDSARDRLSSMLQQAYDEQRRGLLIVHGKGRTAKLKNHVIHWLKQIPWVLFFCSAQPKHGGTGALYVILKRKKPQQNLNAVRSKIDDIDKAITALLCERLAYAKKAAKLKGTTAKDQKREQEIIDKVCQQTRNLGCPVEHIKAIFEVLLVEMKKYQ